MALINTDMNHLTTASGKVLKNLKAPLLPATPLITDNH
jgi:hypothetical protein